MKKNKKLTCPICLNKISKLFVIKNGYKLYRCENCQFLFVWPIPQDYVKIYQENYFCGSESGFGYSDYNGDKEILLENFKKYLKILNRFSLKKGRLLDVGAANGIFVELANSYGWSASGIEIAEDASKISRNNKLKIVTGNFENYNFPKNNFDVITFWDVLEHFSNPEIVIKKAFHSLKSGGILAINTPDSASLPARIFGKKWHLIVPPEHLNYFNLKSLEIIFKRNNFKIIYKNRVCKKFSLQYIFKTLSSWHKFFIWKKIYKYLSKKKLGSLGVKINTYDNIFVIAKKI